MRASARRSEQPAGPAGSEGASPARLPFSPWVVAIVIGFVLILLVNLAFIYVAVSGADRVVPSYHLEHR